MGLNRTQVIIIIAVSCAVVLALGLGLGLGLRKDGGQEMRGCHAKLQSPQGHGSSTNGEIWRAAECPTPGQPQCPNGISPPVLLISLDGFRADYMLRNLTPNIERMADCGAHAPYMRAAYPTKTFPNHYTLVTGLYPESHGIIDNKMFDMKLKKYFSIRIPESKNADWWQGEPIWNTAMKEGKKTATMYWPGSEVPIQGMYPDTCYEYNVSTPYEDRVQEVLSFFEGSPQDFPHLVTLYFDQPDRAGHHQGPFGDWVNGNLTYMDNILGQLMDGLVEKNLDKCLNVIVVADHGIAPVNCRSSYTVKLSDYGPTEEYYVYDGVHARMTSQYVRGADGPELVPDPEPAEDVLEKFKCSSAYNNTKDWYVKFYKKEDLPKRYHYARHHRIDDIVLDIGEEYSVYGSDDGDCEPGDHGYDNRYKSMHAIFLAVGPSFKYHPAMQMFENIEIYNLIAELLKLQSPAPNNGTVGRLHHILADPSQGSPTSAPESDYLECGFPDNRPDRDSRRSNSDCGCQSIQNYTSKDIDDVDLQLDLQESEKATSQSVNAKWGIPELDWSGATVCELVQHDYITGYSHHIKMAAWTAFKLDKRSGWSVISHQYRTDDEDRSCVRVDVRLSVSEQTKCEDYTDPQQGISHGFLYPPGFSDTTERKLDAFISTNIAPMYDSFRKGIWRETMVLLEDYTEKYGELHVTLGPVFDYNADGLADSIEELEANPNVKYVNNGPVPVPTHYYVVVTKPATSLSLEGDTLTNNMVLSVILPHKPDIANCMDRRQFAYQFENSGRVKDVALLTNLMFFPGLDDTLERVRLLTFLPEKLWAKLGWLDVHGDGEDSCPDVSEVECPAGYDPAHPPVLLISIDGFRPDYLDHKVTPVIERMSRCGVSTPFMRSIYPTLTFPNHYTQVTGLYPEVTGIIDNSMYDMDIKAPFFLGSPNTFNPEWWGGEPMWNTLVKHNKTSMTMFWPGSDVAIQDLRPTDYFTYNGNYPYHLRVSTVLDWLTGAKGPVSDFVSLYFSKVDEAGHEGGPNSFQVLEAIENMDGYIQQLMDGIYRLGLLKCVNVITVSDHGMSDISCDRQVFLRDYLPESVLSNSYTYQGAVGRMSTQYRRSGNDYIHIPPEEQESDDEIIDQLMCKNPVLGVYDKHDLPVRNHYTDHSRIENIILKAIDRYMVQIKPRCRVDRKGKHGWENYYPSVKAYFSGYGPSFKTEFRTEAFENIELYNLLSELCGVSPAPNNGSYGALNHMLREEPAIPPSQASPVYSQCLYPGSEGEYNRRANLTGTGCQCVITEGTIKQYDEQLNLDAASKNTSGRIHVPHGIPGLIDQSDLCILHHTDYVSGYSGLHQMALWSAFTLTASQNPSLKTDLTNCLRPDVRLEPDKQYSCNEYQQGEALNITGGSLFPSDFASSNASQLDTRILSNTVPMYKGFKTGVWQGVLERLVEWTAEYSTLHVVSGPLFDHDRNGRRDHNMTVFVGDTDIPLPSHYYVVVFKCPSSDCDTTGDYDMQAFVFLNRQNVTNCLTLDEYLHENVARVRDVELLTDLEFVTNAHTQVAMRRKTFTPIKVWDVQRL